jgi:uncharacterized protein
MNPYVLLFAGTSIFIAAVVRGYSGFGFSMIATVSLTLVMPPAEVVPVILLLEVIASGWLLPRVWKQVDWTSLIPLSAGVVIGTPIGLLALVSIPAAPMRAGIAFVVLGFVALMWRGWRQSRMPQTGSIISIGALSGLLNGSTTMGGPPVILFYLSGPAGAAVSRASMIVFFLGTDFIALAMAFFAGLITPQTGLLGICAIPPLLAGIFCGSRLFRRSIRERFQSRALTLLVVLAVAALIRVIWQMIVPR